MGKSSSAPTPPDYQPIAQSDETAARLAAQTSQQQLDWAKQQYNDIAPYTKAYLQSMTSASDQNLQNAQKDRSRYENLYQPVENQFVNEAQTYNSPDQANQRAGQAEADVASAYAGQRQAALSQLESYGIDPSQTRYGALDLGTRISQAAAQAAAGTQSRQQTQATGLALQSEAINIGRGYPGQVAQSYATAQNTGQSGLNAFNNQSNTYGNLMGTATQWGNQSLAGNAGAVGAMNTGFQNQFQNYQESAQIASQNASGIGSLVGGLGMAGILAFSDRRLKEDIHKVGALKSGLPVYTFRYKGDPQIRMGVMAQDVKKKQPGAVAITPSGYMAVDYSRVK